MYTCSTAVFANSNKFSGQYMGVLGHDKEQKQKNSASSTVQMT